MQAEAGAESAADVMGVLEMAGFEPLWRYQKYRRTYDCEGAEVVVDETPAGSFLEIEGEPDAIERVVERLGADAGRRITGSYRDVWEAACRERGVEPGDMLFEDPAGEGR